MEHTEELNRQIEEWQLDFGRKMTAYRTKHGFTPQQMAETLRITEQLLFEYESGFVMPTIYQISSFFHILNINSYDFYGDDDFDSDEAAGIGSDRTNEIDSHEEVVIDKHAEDEKPPLFTAYEDSFSDAQYLLLRLREVQKLSISDIARTRNLPIENVRKVYKRAKTTQKKLYLARIAQATGKTPRQITREYKEWADMFAYLERNYGDILSSDKG